MVYRKIKNYLDVTLMAEVNKLLEILLFSKAPIYLIIIGRIVLMIRWRGEDRREPYTLDTKALTGVDITVVKIIKSLYDSADIAYSVAV